MSTLNDKLKDIYETYKNSPNPPVPIDTIKEYLELEGILQLPENDIRGV